MAIVKVEPPLIFSLAPKHLIMSFPTRDSILSIHHKRTKYSPRSIHKCVTEYGRENCTVLSTNN